MRTLLLRLTLLLAVLLAACAGGISQDQPVASPSANEIVGPVYLDEIDLRVMESMPVQLGLHLVGSLPTPCHQLAWQADIPGTGGRIDVEVYSQAPADQACIQVLSPLDETVNLGQVQPGHYSVFVNGESVGEFDA